MREREREPRGETPTTPASPPAPAGRCQICGATHEASGSILCRVCGEPVLRWGWA